MVWCCGYIISHKGGTILRLGAIHVSHGHILIPSSALSPTCDHLGIPPPRKVTAGSIKKEFDFMDQAIELPKFNGFVKGD